ncbi:MAG: 4Fe-4S dicluster domain-containing protein [Magnetococcus sp. DMHC-6]
MQRRTFLQQLIFASAVGAGASTPFALARLMTPNANAAPHTHLRPPGALQNEQAFIEACIGCGYCGEACPVGAIRFYTREGGNKINTPYINPEIKACTLSGHCMKVCPTNALTETPIKEIKMGIAKIDRSGCYPWVDRGVCGACVTGCPVGKEAITFAFANFYRPVVLKGCVGCGVCVEVCPHPSLPIKIVSHLLAVNAPESIVPEPSLPPEIIGIVEKKETPGLMPF